MEINHFKNKIQLDKLNHYVYEIVNILFWRWPAVKVICLLRYFKIQNVTIKPLHISYPQACEEFPL